MGGNNLYSHFRRIIYPTAAHIRILVLILNALHEDNLQKLPKSTDIVD